MGAQFYASLNGNRLIKASLAVPYYGLWEGDVTLATPVVVTNPVTLVIGNLQLVGSVYRQAMFAGVTGLHIIAGAGGWRTPIGAQNYTNTGGLLLSTILKDAATLVGEKVNVATDRNVGTNYVRLADLAQRVLAQLAGPEWYVDAAGVTQVGARPSVAIASQFNVIDFAPSESLFDVATEDPASWMPGNTFSCSTVTIAQTISLARFSVEDSGVARVKVLGVS